MAAGICLMKETADAFIQAVKDGKIDPGKLADMSSAERNAFFEQIVGKNHATAVNSLFESKLLLKNQQRGMVTWAKQVSGIKPQARRDLIAKIERMQSVLDPEEKKQFMHDLTATRLGVDVTQEEAKNIADLSKKVSDLQTVQRADKTFPSKEARLNYGRAVEDLTDYVGNLKREADKLKVGDFKTNAGGSMMRLFSKTAGNMKSISASMDNSAIFRQGWKTLLTHPNIWRKNAIQSFANLVKQFGGRNVMREVNADIISRPTYDLMVRAKLAIKNPEEFYPESLAEKVPLAGRAYKASEAAYTAFVYKTRADVFDKYLQLAQKNGLDLQDTDNLVAIGKMVNSLTGRGSLGKLEPVANTVNNFFFSPRFLKSNIDTLVAPVKLLGGKDPMFVRKNAALNTLKIIAGTATVLGIADTLLPGSVDFDPRSSNFGKIKVGDTRFDVSGGMGSILTLAARLATDSSKSSTTGKVTKLNSGTYGSVTLMDELTSFVTNKTSPAASVLVDVLKGQDFNGNKPTVINEAKNTLTPMGIQNAQELLSDPNSANALVGILSDGLGISANTYSASGGGGATSWSQSTSKELAQFKQAVGAKKFNADAHLYDNQFNTWINVVQKASAYQKLSTDDQSKLITKKKAQLKDSIFKANSFKYVKQKSNPELKSLL